MPRRRESARPIVQGPSTGDREVRRVPIAGWRRSPDDRRRYRSQLGVQHSGARELEISVMTRRGLSRIRALTRSFGRSLGWLACSGRPLKAETRVRIPWGCSHWSSRNSQSSKCRPFVDAFGNGVSSTMRQAQIPTAHYSSSRLKLL